MPQVARQVQQVTSPFWLVTSTISEACLTIRTGQGKGMQGKQREHGDQRVSLIGGMYPKFLWQFGCFKRHEAGCASILNHFKLQNGWRMASQQPVLSEEFGNKIIISTILKSRVLSLKRVSPICIAFVFFVWFLNIPGAEWIEWISPSSIDRFPRIPGFTPRYVV